MDVEEFPQRLREAREARGMSQQMLASAAHLATRTVAGLESGQYKGNARTITRLCEILQIAPTWLLMGEGERDLFREEP